MPYNKMYPKEMQPGMICNILFGFFIEYITELEESKRLVKNDENNKRYIVEAASCLLSAENVKKRIEKMWGLRKDLLAGVFIYLDVLDDYFNPKLNTKDLFFRKNFTYNSDLLEKVGKKVVKPAFPFVSCDNHIKKILLIR